MNIVQDGPFNSGICKETCKGWLPDTFCKPHSRRLDSKVALDALAQTSDLSNFVAIRNHRKDWFVVASAHNLNLIALNKSRHTPDKLRVSIFQPVQQRACIVQCEAYSRMSF